MKKCVKCLIQKEDTEFGNKKASLDGLQSYCKECNNTKYKEWYRHNRIARIKYCTNFTKKNRKKIIEWYREIKRNTPCKDCGKIYSPWVMEFDHLDSHKKDFNVSKLVAKNCCKDRILKEIEKCELVCANCHRERTWQRHLKSII
jgi:hypothetical protein